MKTLKNLRLRKFLPLLLIMAMGIIGCSDDDAATTVDTELDIVETAIINDDFSTLAGAITDAGLVPALKSDGPFTVFAPTNEAFANLPAGLLASLSTNELSNILQYHVIPAEVSSGDLIERQAPASLTGESIYVTVDAGEVTVNNNPSVILADISASNGIIHAIDEVILPNEFLNVVQLVSKNYELSTLVDLVSNAGLVQTLQGSGPYTVFAPTNEAFAEVQSTLETLTPEQVTEVLLYHVVAAEAFSSTLSDGQTVPTAQGEDITVSTNAAGEVILNGSVNVSSVDLDAINGVVHIIDGILLPPSFQN